MFKALASRNFRLYYFSQGISFCGNLIQEIALAWLVYKLTGEAFYVGLLLFIKQIPAFFLSPVAGVLSDQVSKKAILITTNLLMLVMAFSMGLVVLADFHVIFLIFTIQFISGLIAGIDLPVRQAFVKELVADHSQLINAIALNSSLFNIARIGSPLLAGILIPIVGEGVCFLINGTSYLTVIVAILMMRNIHQDKRSGRINFLNEIKEGLTYTFSHSSLKKIMVVTAGISLFGFPFSILLPAFTKQVLQGDVQVLGLLTTATGVGSLISAMYLASRRSTRGLQVLVCIACFISGSGIIFLSNTSMLVLSIITLIQVGIGQVFIFSSCNSIIQTEADPRMTGRVLSLYIMTFMGSTMIGSLLVGALADNIGVPSTLMICGSGCIATGLYLLASVKSIRKRMMVRLKVRKSARKLTIEQATS